MERNTSKENAKLEGQLSFQKGQLQMLMLKEKAAREAVASGAPLAEVDARPDYTPAAYARNESRIGWGFAPSPAEAMRVDPFTVEAAEDADADPEPASMALLQVGAAETEDSSEDETEDGSEDEASPRPRHRRKKLTRKQLARRRMLAKRRHIAMRKKLTRKQLARRR